MKRVSRRDDGLLVIHNGDVSMVVCIPSRGRAHRVVNHPFFALGNIFVAEDEMDEYGRTFADAKAIPGALVPHNADGSLPRIRNFMLDHKREADFEMQLDDDYAGMHYLFTLRSAQTRTSDPRRIIDIFTRSYLCASDMGTGLFCYAQTAVPYERHSFSPFRLRGWGMGACMGHLRPDVLRFDENLRVKDDLDLCLQAVGQFKYLWQDMRYWGWCDETGGRTGADTGGLANIRTSEAELKDVLYLQRKYGRDVVTPDGKKRGSGMTVRVKIPQKYKE